MTVSCDHLIRFVDDELDDEEADVFRTHLAGCDVCQRALVEEEQLSVRLAGLSPPSEQATPAPGTTPEPTEDIDKPPASEAAPTPTPTPTPEPSSHRWVAVIATGFAAAAGLVFFVATRPARPARIDAFAGLMTRPYEVRLAHPDAAAYRPTREHTLGATPAKPTDRVSYSVLGALEERNDKYTLALARAWSDPAKIVVDQLRAIDQKTASIRSDLAAFEALTTQGDNAQSVLAELERLEREPDLAVARAARWNHAILLARLDLPLSAARLFQDIAVEGEAGWADEARRRAASLEQRMRGQKERWQLAVQVEKDLRIAGAAVPRDLLQQFPGAMRDAFYKAVRTAPDRARVLALAPMAEELDRLAQVNDHPAATQARVASNGVTAPGVLARFVQWVAGRDFARRAPLAEAYARLLDGEAAPPALLEALGAKVPLDDVLDIIAGAADATNRRAAQRETIRRLHTQTGDPWVELLLARADADHEQSQGHWLEAEATLRNAHARCTPALAYPCLFLDRDLGRLYAKLHMVPAALAALRPALATARSRGAWERQGVLLWQLADVERLHSSTAMARAYAGEYLLALDTCKDQQWGYRTLAGAAVLDVDGRAARHFIDEAVRCKTAEDVILANYLADIGRLDPRPDDLPRLRSMLDKLRAGKPGATDLALYDVIEGRLLLESDRAAGRALIEKAITAVDKLAGVVADKVRAGGYSALVLAAGRDGDHARVLSLIADDLGLPPPGPCSVAMVGEDGRSAVAVRGIDGRDHGAYTRTAPRVSAELAQHLSGCAHVRVMAPATLQTRPHVLPAELSWSYATDARTRTVPAAATGVVSRTLIVTDVAPPGDLGLPALEPAPVVHDPSTTILSGDEATPSRVLAAMATATEIQFHTHALVDLGVSDASHLVLSRGPDGRYALTAEAIGGAQLGGHPIVVLAACRSAQGAHYQHAPWSLPTAFLAAGARAVFASAQEIPDRQAKLFFDRVMQRVRAGADPASALRDERVSAITADPSSWAADVILFE